MFKSRLRLLFGTLTQLIAVIISYQFYFKYAASHGGRWNSNKYYPFVDMDYYSF